MKFIDGSCARLMGGRQHSQEVQPFSLSKGRDNVLTDWVQPAAQHNTVEQKQDRHGKISDALRLLISLQKTDLISVKLSIDFDGDTFKILCLYFSGAITVKYTSNNVFLYTDKYSHFKGDVVI